MRLIAMRALLVSVVIGALLGIFGILAGNLGNFGIKIMLTSFAVGGASALIMASLAAWQLPAGHVMSRLGVFGSLVALATVLFGMWVEMNSDSYWKLAFTCVVVAAVGAHGSLTSLAKLAPRHQWLRPVALATTAFLGAGVCAAIWSEVDGNVTWKAIAILGILDVAFTLVLGALDFMNRNAAPEGGVAEVCFCPGCGRRLFLPAGEVRCHHCKACFFIELRPSSDLPTAITR
jgi:hypothetical protein